MAVYEPIDRRQRQEHEQQSMECRASRHWWQREHAAPADWNPSPIFIGAKHVVHHVCIRCGTWRHKAFNHLGLEPHTHYQYPDWYKRPGEGKVTAEELRLWEARQVARVRRAARKGAG